jgi:hypothetical protein
VDDSLLTSYKFDKFFFQNTRYVNALLDYEAYLKNKFKIQRSYIAPNNKLCIYQKTSGKNILNLSPGIHKITYQVSDFSGNTTSFTFKLRILEHAATLPKKHNGIFVSWNKNFEVDSADFKILILAGSLYDTAYLQIKTLPSNTTDQALSKILLIGNPYIPLQQPIIISLKPKIPITKDMLIVLQNPKGQISALPTFVQGQFLKASSYNFGKFFVLRDTIAPTISFIAGKSIYPGQKIKFKIRDNLSGIDKYDVFVNGQWTLFAYDSKTSTLSATADTTHFKHGTNKIKYQQN